MKLDDKGCCTTGKSFCCATASSFLYKTKVYCLNPLKLPTVKSITKSQLLA